MRVGDLEGSPAVAANLGNVANGDEGHDRVLVRIYWYLGRASQELGSEREAIADFQKSIAISQDLTERPFVDSSQAKTVRCLLLDRWTFGGNGDAQPG